MSSRMERYKSDIETPNKSRVNKNNSLYETIKSSDLSRVRNNDNIKIIESNGKTIDISKIRKYLEENNNKKIEPRKRVVNLDDFDVETVKREEIKDYDINSVLENAKKTREIDYDRERYKKLRREEYDILNKLKVYDEEEKPITEEDFNTEEKTLIDLINTVTIHKGELNLLEDLIGEEGEETTLPIEEEKTRESFNKKENTQDEKDTSLDKTKELVNLKEKTMELDNSFYTSSMSFSKEDFDGFDEIEKSVKKNSVLTTFLLILLILFILATLFIIANYVFDLGLF